MLIRQYLFVLVDITALFTAPFKVRKYTVSTAEVILNETRLHELGLEEEAVMSCTITMVLRFEPNTYRIQVKRDVEPTG